MLVFRVGTLVELRRPRGVVAGELLVLRSHRDRLVGDRVERAVGLGSERHALDRRRPIAEPVHLLAGQHEPHRALQLLRREHGQHHLILRTQARAERAADERRHDAHIVRVHAEYAADIALHVLHALRLVVDRQLAVAVPPHRRGKQLHRIVMLDRDEIFGLVAHSGRRIGFRRVAARLIGFVDDEGLIEPRVQVGDVGFRLVFDPDERRREARNLPLFGHHQRDRLSVELDLVIVERAERRAARSYIVHCRPCRCPPFSAGSRASARR